MRTLLLVLVACSTSSSTSPRISDRPAPIPGRGPEDTVPPTALAQGQCDDATLLTLEAIGRGDGNGERIAFDTVPRAEIFCTLLACFKSGGGEAECCNNCGGAYGVRVGDELHVRLTGLPGRCGGMDCNIHCEPFGIKPTTQYRFVGKNSYTKRLTNGAVYDKVEFAVEKYCRL